MYIALRRITLMQERYRNEIREVAGTFLRREGRVRFRSRSQHAGALRHQIPAATGKVPMYEDCDVYLYTMPTI